MTVRREDTSEDHTFKKEMTNRESRDNSRKLLFRKPDPLSNLPRRHSIRSVDQNVGHLRIDSDIKPSYLQCCQRTLKKW